MTPRLRALVTALAGLLLLIPAPSFAEEGRDCELGLVLSGGGARGIAHIGVLEVLVEEGVWPDCIAGASMGSIVGALFAAGHPPGEIHHLLRDLNWRNLYTEPGAQVGRPLLHRLEQERTALRLGLDDGDLRLPGALLDDILVNRILMRHLAPAGFAAGRDFAALPISFRTVGTNLVTGDRLVMAEGDLALAVRGSMAVPLAYPPVWWGDALLVDGGLVDNVPVGLAKQMGADFVLAVDVSTPLEREVVADLFGITKRIIDLLFTAKNSQYAQPPDLRIRPEIGDHSFASYSDLDFLVEAGREAARQALDQIPERYRGRPRPARLRDIHAEAFAGRTVTSIAVEGNEYLDDDVIFREFPVEPGAPFNFDEALGHLDHLSSSGLLTRAWMDVLPDGPDGVRLELDVEEQYRHTVDLGLAYKTDHQAQALLRFETRNLLGRGDRLQLRGFASAQDLIGGLRLHGEQAFGAHLGYQIDAEVHRERPKVYVDGEEINRAEFLRRHAEITANVPFALDTLFQVGFRFGEVEVTDRLGLDELPPITNQHRVLVARYIHDDLDSVVLPDAGHRFSILAERNIDGFGGFASYWKLEGDFRGAFPLGSLAAEVRARYGYSTDDLPEYDWFRLGGPGLVPGLAREEIWGRQLIAGSAALGYDPFSVVRIYGRVGAGNVWDRVEEISLGDVLVGAGLGVVVATPIGPIRMDYGWAEGNRRQVYFSIGWQ